MARVDQVERFIAASDDAIYRALVDGDALVDWLPPSDMTGRIEGYRPEVGARFQMVLTYRDPARRGKSTGASDVVRQTVVELTPDRVVAWRVHFDSPDPVFAGDMTMTWTITPTGDGCLLRVAATDVPEGVSAADHQTGMTSSLANLAAYLGDAS